MSAGTTPAEGAGIAPAKETPLARTEGPKKEKDEDENFLLAQKAARGDEKAFEELYQKYRTQVYDLCRQILKDESAAEDATQEVFLHLYQKIGSFEGKSKFTTWLYRVAVNTALMSLRRKKKIKEEGVESHILQRHLEKQAGGKKKEFEEEAIARIDSARVIEKLEELSQGYRKILELYSEGFTHNEIAKSLGIAVGTVKSQISKGLKRLRTLLPKDRDIDKRNKKGQSEGQRDKRGKR